jgi:WD40 repeat protein
VKHPDYWAFLSYSHQDNLETRKDGTRGCIRWAEWLHEALEQYRVPKEFRDRTTATGEKMPERFFPVFQDEKELPINADLGDSIRKALERAPFLIVICSPRSAISRYVNEEVRYFKELGRQNRIMTLMIDGEPNASVGNKAGYTAADECFCPALRFSLDENEEIDTTRSDAQEPIAGDVRIKDSASVREAKQRDLSSHQPMLEYMKLKLLAGLMGIGFDDLAQRDKIRALQEARTKARRARRIATIVGGLALLAIVSAFFAFQQKKNAERETKRALAAEQTAEEKTAEVVRNLSRADFIAADEAIKAGLNQQALARLARAVRGDPHNSAAGRRLLFLLLQQPWFVPAPPGKVITGLSPSPPDPAAAAQRASARAMAEKQLGTDRKGDIVAVSDSGGAAAIVRDTRKVEWLDNPPAPESRSRVDVGFAIQALAFSPDEERLVAVGGFQDEYGHHGDIAVLRKDESRTEPRSLDRGPIPAVEFSPDDRLFVSAGSWWDSDAHLLGTFFPGDEAKIAFSADGRTVTMGDSHSVQLGRQPISKSLGEDPADGSTVLVRDIVSPDATYSISLADKDRGTLTNQKNGHQIKLPESTGSRRFLFTPDSRRIVATDSDLGSGLIWEAATAQIIGRFPATKESWAIATSNQLVLTATEKKTVLWDLAKGSPAGAPIDAGWIVGAAFHPDGERLLLILQDKSARLWDIAKATWISETIVLPDTGSKATFAPDGSCFATSSVDGGAGFGDFQLWDTETMRPLSTPIAGREIFGEREAPLGPFRFTPSWQLLFSAGPPEGTEQIAQYLALDVPQSNAPAPGWLADLAEAVAGLRLTTGGVFVRIEPATLWQTVAAVRATTMRGDDTWSATIRWWLDESVERTISPRSAVKVSEYVKRRLASTEIHDLVVAGRAAPDNENVFARLAAVAAKNEFTQAVALSAGRRARWLRATSTKAIPPAQPAPPAPTPDAAETEFARGEALRKAGDKENEREALACYQRAVELGHVAALHRIGVLYARGLGGGKPDDKKALEWYRKAAEKNFAEAQYDLGVRYIRGLGLDRPDEAAGLELCRKAAAQGWQDAIDMLRDREKAARHK